jgi:hypothetical protein
MGTTPTRQRAGSAADRNKQITTAMQWEIFSEEGRPLLWSHMVSVGFGLTFLMLAVFGPRPITVPHPEMAGPPIGVDMSRFVPESSLPAVGSSSGAARSGGAGARSTRSASGGQNEGGIAEVFRRAGINPGGMPGAGAGVLRGVQTSSGDGYNGLASIGSSAHGAKAALTYGDATGSGSGRAGLGDGTHGVGGRFGGVSGVGGGVTRSVLSISAPSVVAEKLGAPGRDVSQLGTLVRDRQAVLQSCYTQEGLAVNPKLAGTVDVAITLDGAGSVARVAAKPRSMSGPGTSQVMSCIEAKIGTWKFPRSDAGTGTYAFPFSFTS